MGDTLETCKNCGEEFEKDFKFCPHCGQQVRDKLTVAVLFYNTISNYFSFDAKFFKSFIPLMTRPGYLAKTFIEGKRLLYLHPAQLYLFVSVVFFFLLSVLVVKDKVQNLDKSLKEATARPLLNDSLEVQAVRVMDSIKIDSILKPLEEKGVEGLSQVESKVLDSLVKNRVKKDISSQSIFGYNSKKIDSLIDAGTSDDEVYKAMGMKDDAGVLTRKFYAQALKLKKKNSGEGILQYVYDAIPISLFILLPIFALILKLFFYSKGAYAHHLVFSFYFFSFLFMAFSLLMIINYFFNLPGALDFLIITSTFFYLFIAIRKFYKSSWFGGLIKTGVITFIYLSFVVPVAFVILLFVGILFY